MTRFALTANEDATEAAHVPYVLLAEFDFASGFVRVNSGSKSYTHDGNTYGALGTLGGLGPVRENGNLTPEKLEFQLSGVDNSLLSTTLTEDYHGRSAKLWVGYLNEQTLELITTPQIIWEGVMDTMSIRAEQNRSTIAMVCENHLIRWGESAGWTYTQEHQRIFDTTDDFFNQVAVLSTKIVKWGGGSVVGGVDGRGRTPGPGRDRGAEERGK